MKKLPRKKTDITRNFSACLTHVRFADSQLKGKDGGQSIGRISKQWSGLLKEVFTDTDNFGIQFPLDMDVKMKAVLMGTCFLIVSVIVICCFFGT